MNKILCLIIQLLITLNLCSQTSFSEQQLKSDLYTIENKYNLYDHGNGYTNPNNPNND